MKTLRELRTSKAKRSTHLVTMRLSASDEEKLVKILVEKEIGFTRYLNDLLTRELEK